MRSKSISRLALLGLAATALLLAALACGKDATPSDTECQSSANAQSESREEQVFTSQTDSDYQNNEYSKRKKELMESYTPDKGLEFQPEWYQENWRRWRAEEELAHEVREKYDDMFWRQPNVYSVGVGVPRGLAGDPTGVVGIVIEVTERVCQEDLPPEDRIPEVLEGVPVFIEELIPVDGWDP